MIHELKIKSEFFQKIANREKPYEVRNNDRQFEIGDLLALNEIDSRNKYTKRSLLVEVKDILDDESYTKKGYVIMTIAPCIVKRGEVGFPMHIIN